MFVSAGRRADGDCAQRRVLWVAREAGHEVRVVVEGERAGPRREYHLREGMRRLLVEVEDVWLRVRNRPSVVLV